MLVIFVAEAPLQLPNFMLKKLLLVSGKYLSSIGWY